MYENLPQGFLVLEKRGMAVGFEHKEKIVLAKNTEADGHSPLVS